MPKLSPSQSKALLVIRQNGGSIVANSIIASRNRVTFATLVSLEKAGYLTSSLYNPDALTSQWQFSVKD